MSNHNEQQDEFDYIWILRCSGSNCNRNVEYKLLPEAPTRNITPLLEVIDEGIFHQFRSSLRRKYGKIYLEFPRYLIEHSNKFRRKPNTTLRNYANCIDFISNIQIGPDIPVISAFHDP